MSGEPVLLITGASSGIGAAVARRFGPAGYRLVLAARRFDLLSALADELNSQGGEALPVAADVSQFDDIQRLVQAALEQYKQIDILFNNAGFGRLDWLEGLDPRRDVQAQVQVNLLGLIWTSQAVLPHMIERRSGHIINMSSLAGWIAPPTYSVYAATKFGVRGFTEALRREVGPYGIHVSGIYPGSVDTEFRTRARIRRKTGMTTPRRMRLTADEVAQAVFSLAQRPRRAVIMPGYMRFVIAVNRLFPGLVDWAVRVRFVEVERE
jgi:NADP-dependent 3-hydroxy acid dehydrogenase YdfG